MTVVVKVIAGAKRQSLAILDEKSLKVKVTQKAHDNLANKAVTNLLADYFKIPKKSVIILKGIKSSNKLIEVGGIHELSQ